jgi:ketosteroid isomerase-like protein
MGGHTDTLKGGYQAFRDGDAEGMKAAWTDDIRWEGPNAMELPGGGRHEGADDILQMLGQIGERWESFEVSPDEFHEDGDTVIVLGKTTATPKDGGDQVTVPFVHVWRMQGDKASEVLVLTDTLVVAKALGLAS